MSIKLVIVDDAPFMREVVRNIAIKNGMKVLGEAVNGEQAVDAVLQLRPDVVLMDLVMPEKNGLEATRDILDAWPECRIVACTTESQAHLMAEAIDVGCCDYITKPFEGDDVVKALESAHKGVLEEDK